MSALTLGSGVARELVSPAAAVEPTLDSRFLTDSFLGLPGFSRDMAAAVAAAARSGLGFSGEETGGAWSSSSGRFWGREEGGGEEVDEAGRTGTGTGTGTGVTLRSGTSSSGAIFLTHIIRRI